VLLLLVVKVRVPRWRPPNYCCSSYSAQVSATTTNTKHTPTFALFLLPNAGRKKTHTKTDVFFLPRNDSALSQRGQKKKENCLPTAGRKR